MSAATSRKGLEPGSTVRVVRAGGHWSDSVGNFAVPDGDEPLTIRHLAPGRYTAIGEHGDEIEFEVLAGEEETRVLTRGASSEGVRDPGASLEPVPGEAGAGVQTVDELRGAKGEPLPAMVDGVVSKEGADGLGQLVSNNERRTLAAALEDDSVLPEQDRREKERAAATDDLKGDELRQRASELGIEGRSSMSADDLREAIAGHPEGGGSSMSSSLRFTAEARAQQERERTAQSGPEQKRAQEGKKRGVTPSDTQAPKREQSEQEKQRVRDRRQEAARPAASPSGERTVQGGSTAGGGLRAKDVETDQGGPRDKAKDQADVKAQGKRSRES